MLNWLYSNMANVIICVVLAAIVAAVIAGMIRKKRKGNSSCGCGCSGCPMSGNCENDRK